MKRQARTIRCYVDHALQVDESIALDKRASHHLSTVLRLDAGQAIELFNGSGHAYAAVVESTGKQTHVYIKNQLNINTESVLHSTLVQCISRGDKMDTSIQKATELGVNEIRPVYSRHAIKKLDDQRALKKMQHWQSIAISASEQSGRCYIPHIAAPETLEHYLSSLQQNNDESRLLLAPTAQGTLATLSNVKRVSLLIGPEAGLDQDEIEQAHNAQFEAVQFGPRILRTETAGPAVLAVLQAYHGDIKAAL